MNRRVRQIIGDLGRERGRNNENRVWQLVNNCRSLWPEWFQGARLASKIEDRKRIDLVAMSDVGKLFFQIKSSEAGRKKFESQRHRLPIELIVVKNTDTDPVLYQKVLAAAGRLRDRFLAKRNRGTL